MIVLRRRRCSSGAPSAIDRALIAQTWSFELVRSYPQRRMTRTCSSIVRRRHDPLLPKQRHCVHRRRISAQERAHWGVVALSPETPAMTTD